MHPWKDIPVTYWRLKSSKHSFLSYEYGYQATNFHINYVRHNTTHSCKAPPIAPPSSGGRPPRLGDHFYLDSSAVSQKRDHCIMRRPDDHGFFYIVRPLIPFYGIAD